MAESILARPDPRDVLAPALDLAVDGLKRADVLLAALVCAPSLELARVVWNLVHEYLELIAGVVEPASSAP